jgi:hypothetical protein
VVSDDVVKHGGHIAALAFNMAMMPFYKALGFHPTDKCEMHRMQLVATGSSDGPGTGSSHSDVDSVVAVPHVGFGLKLSDEALWRVADAVHESRAARAAGTAADADGTRATGAHGGTWPLVDAAVRDAWAALVDYDATVFPARRETFLHMWLANTLAAVQWRDSEHSLSGSGASAGSGAASSGGVRGYGCVRQSDVGYRVGPLFADSDAIAAALLKALLARVPAGEKVFVDVPEGSSGLVAALAAVDVAVAASSVVGLRVIAGEMPGPSMARVYGITTTEAG